MKNPFRLTTVTLLLAVPNLHAATHYVSLESTNPTPPYTDWVTAATNIQDAVNVTVAGDWVMVTNGVYPGGVVATKRLTLLSVNGPQFTIIDGGGVAQCLYVPDGASLTGFTLTNGTAGGNGTAGVTSSPHANILVTNCVVGFNTGSGASWCTLYSCTLTHNTSGIGGGGAGRCTLYNCTLTGNSAPYGGGAEACILHNCILAGNTARYGGGADDSALYNCILTGNTASAPAPYDSGGGGAFESALYNCTVTGNSAPHAAGGEGTFYNCIAYYNTPDNFWGPSTTLTNCCTTPLPTTGAANITNAPLFVDYANGNLHLQANSPCINGGSNLRLTNQNWSAQFFTDVWVTNVFDLDGNPRIVSGTVDIGAYEYQGTGSVISYAWLQQYGLPTDGSGDFIDSDDDGMNNWQEWVCGTNPTNAQSALRLLSAMTTPTNATVTWQSVARVNYFLERSPNLARPFTLLASNLVAQAAATAFTDTKATGAGPFFYRVGVASQ
jgi:hypothetical protein